MTLLHLVLLLSLDPHERFCPTWAPIESHTDVGTFCSSETPTETTWEIFEGSDR